MKDKLDEIINSNHDLEKYLKVYGKESKFLLRYYLQDANRILVNYYAYGNYLSLENKIYMVYQLLGKESINIIDPLLTDILIKVDDLNNPEIKKLLNYLLKLDKENKLNIDDLLIKGNIYELDPLYAIKKDIKNIGCFSKISDSKKVHELLIEASINKYQFTNQNKLLIINSILDNDKELVYFINNCNHEKLDNLIINYLKKLTNKRLCLLYKKINDNKLKRIIVNKVNYNNFDINSVIDNEEIYLKTDNNLEKTLEFLKKAKLNNINSIIVLIMDRVNMPFIDEAYKIYGNKLRISPIDNQEKKWDCDDVWDMPYYTVNSIKKTEYILDLYASCVKDKIDKYGNVKTLSPLEKYIGAYIMTIKFSPYKKEKNDKYYHTSRSVYEFVDKKNNKKIVCVGYVHLLRELLFRMGIKETIDWDVHVPKRDEEDDYYINHLRMMIYLKDPKYNIDGVYMVDPTWDEDGLNSLKTSHMLMSINELEIVDERLSKEDLKVSDLDELKQQLKVKNVSKLFNKPISKDTITKAFLALEHFLDLNMTMVDNNKYGKREYKEMTKKLGF